MEPDWGAPLERVLPELEAASAPGPGMVGGPKTFVRGYRFSGNSVIGTERLEALSAPYTGREVLASELEALRRSLSLEYARLGYINSGAFFPDQDLADGIVEVTLAEGRLDNIRVSGNSTLPTPFLTNRLDPIRDAPLNLLALERQLQLLQSDSRIDQLSAELRPGDRAGSSLLVLDVEEARPWGVSLTLDNDAAPSIGEYQMNGQFSHLNLTGAADELTVELGVAEGLLDTSIAYARPINESRTRVHVGFEYADGEVVEDPFDDLDIESRNATWRLGISRPFLEHPGRSLVLGLRIDRRKSRNWLLDDPFSFSAGADNGESRVTAVRAQQDFRWRNRQHAVGIRSVLSVGIDAFNATINQNRIEDGQFVSWLGQAVWARRSAGGSELISKLHFQLSNDALLPMEQFALGGAQSVRGYRRNQVVRDRGIAGSLELRVPVLRNLEGLAQLQLAAFVDYGRGWNHRRESRSGLTIAGAGLGLRWSASRRLTGQVYWAAELKNVPEPRDRSLQDRGLHMRMTYRPD